MFLNGPYFNFFERHLHHVVRMWIQEWISLPRALPQGTILGMETEPTIRRTARVLLIDELDRLLLFQRQDPTNPSDIYWCPVGGGIEPGESPEDAARREVKEETGLTDFDLGRHVWNRQDRYSFNGKNYQVSETWFLSRTPTFEIDTTAHPMCP